jgi:hypothetical protein
MAKKKRTGYENRKNTPSSKKKVVVTTQQEEKQKKIEPTVSRAKRGGAAAGPVKMLYRKEHFILFGIGMLLIVLGMFLMAGGAQVPNE